MKSNINLNELLKSKSQLLRAAIIVVSVVLIVAPGILTLLIVDRSLFLTLSDFKLVLVAIGVSIILYLGGVVTYLSPRQTLVDLSKKTDQYKLFTTISGAVIFSFMNILGVAGFVIFFGELGPLAKVENQASKYGIVFGFYIALLALKLFYNVGSVVRQNSKT